MVRAIALIAVCLMLVGIGLGAQETETQGAVPLEQGPVSGSRIHLPKGQQQVVQFGDGKRQIMHSILNVRAPLNYGEYVWDDTGVPAGALWARVDLQRQIVSVFRAGHEIGTAVILYGADDTPTPAGTFPILEKRADYHSRTYDAPMPYMMRLTNDGVALHASTMQRHAVTHGCIGLPLPFAKLIFGQFKVGDPILIVGERPARPN